MAVQYIYFTSYKNAPERIKKQFDNFFNRLKTLRTAYIKNQDEKSIQALQNFYNKMHKSIIYKSSKYSMVYCQILSDVM